MLQFNKQSSPGYICGTIVQVNDVKYTLFYKNSFIRTTRLKFAQNLGSSRIEELFPDFQFPLRNNVKISEHAQNFNVFKPRLVYR